MRHFQGTIAKTLHPRHFVSLLTIRSCLWNNFLPLKFCPVLNKVVHYVFPGEVLPEHMRIAIENQSGSSSGGVGGGPPAVSMGGLVGAGAVGGGSSVVATGGVVGAGPSVTTAAQMTTAKTTTTVTSTTSTSSTIVRPTATTVGGRPSIANTTNIDTLLNAKEKAGAAAERHAKPSGKVQDKVAFIFNNLSLMNISKKSEDLKVGKKLFA